MYNTSSKHRYNVHEKTFHAFSNVCHCCHIPCYNTQHANGCKPDNWNTKISWQYNFYPVYKNEFYHCRQIDRTGWRSRFSRIKWSVALTTLILYLCIIFLHLCLYSTHTCSNLISYEYFSYISGDVSEMETALLEETPTILQLKTTALRRCYWKLTTKASF